MFSLDEKTNWYLGSSRYLSEDLSSKYKNEMSVGVIEIGAFQCTPEGQIHSQTKKIYPSFSYSSNWFLAQFPVSDHIYLVNELRHFNPSFSSLHSYLMLIRMSNPSDIFPSGTSISPAVHAYLQFWLKDHPSNDWLLLWYFQWVERHLFCIHKRGNKTNDVLILFSE